MVMFHSYVNLPEGNQNFPHLRGTQMALAFNPATAHMKDFRDIQRSPPTTAAWSHKWWPCQYLQISLDIFCSILLPCLSIGLPDGSRVHLIMQCLSRICRIFILIQIYLGLPKLFHVKQSRLTEHFSVIGIVRFSGEGCMAQTRCHGVWKNYLTNKK